VTDDQRGPILTGDRVPEQAPSVGVLIDVPDCAVTAGEHNDIVLFGCFAGDRHRVREALVVLVGLDDGFGGFLTHFVGIYGDLVEHRLSAGWRRDGYVEICSGERLQWRDTLLSPVPFL